MKKASIPELAKMKHEGKKLRMVTAYDYPVAAMVDQTDIELILVGDSLGMVVLGYEGTTGVTVEEMIHHIKPVVKGAPKTIIVGDMPFGSYNVSTAQAVKTANRLMKEGGCDAVKLEGGLHVVDQVRAIVNGGIPVMGHIGLTPQTSSQLGGFKVQGKDVESARRIIREAEMLEEAGVFSIVIEAVPSAIGQMITERVSVPTIGIGAGPHCDGQVLVTQDMMGMFDRFTPKFVKQYASVGQTMIEAFTAFAADVSENRFPSEEHCFSIKDTVLDGLYGGTGDSNDK